MRQDSFSDAGFEKYRNKESGMSQLRQTDYWIVWTTPPIVDNSRLIVKSRLVMNALLEQFRFFCVPVFQGLNR